MYPLLTVPEGLGSEGLSEWLAAWRLITMANLFPLSLIISFCRARTSRSRPLWCGKRVTDNEEDEDMDERVLGRDVWRLTNRSCLHPFHTSNF